MRQLVIKYYISDTNKRGIVNPVSLIPFKYNIRPM